MAIAFMGIVAYIWVKLQPMEGNKEGPPSGDLGKNPFSNRLVIPVRKYRSRVQLVKNKQGEVEGNVIAHEYTPSTKIYATASRREMVSHLSLRGKELLLWIMYEIKYGKDFIWINKTNFMDEVGMRDRHTYTAAVNDLIKSGFIAKSVRAGYYWVNPDILFKGDRMKKFPDKVELVYSDEEFLPNVDDYDDHLEKEVE